MIGTGCDAKLTEPRSFVVKASGSGQEYLFDKNLKTEIASPDTINNAMIREPAGNLLHLSNILDFI